MKIRKKVHQRWKFCGISTLTNNHSDVWPLCRTLSNLLMGLRNPTSLQGSWLPLGEKPENAVITRLVWKGSILNNGPKLAVGWPVIKKSIA